VRLLLKLNLIVLMTLAFPSVGLSDEDNTYDDRDRLNRISQDRNLPTQPEETLSEQQRRSQSAYNDHCTKTHGRYYIWSWDSNSCVLLNQGDGRSVSSTSSNGRPDDIGAFCAPIDEAMKDCVSKTDYAKESTCNYKNNSGINNVIKMADGISKMFALGTAANIELACSKMKDFTVASSAAMTAYRSACAVAQNDCIKSCEDASNLLKSNSQFSLYCSFETRGIREAKKQCADFTTNLNEAGFYVQSLYAAKLNADQCKNLTGDSFAKMCKENPSAPLCANLNANTDCSNPNTAKTNPVCICQANPGDPICRGQQRTTVTNSGSQSSGGGGADVGGVGSGGDMSSFSGDGYSDPYSGEFKRPEGGGGGTAAGGKGTPRSIYGDSGGGGSAGNSKDSVGAAGGNPPNTKVLSGFYGGSATGFQSGGGRGSDPQQFSNYNGNNSPKVDLKQFLPGGKLDPRRAMAGIAGPDGLTGPNSSIWQKVSNRYRSVFP
jgi:hypothetical protein